MYLHFFWFYFGSCPIVISRIIINIVFISEVNTKREFLNNFVCILLNLYELWWPSISTKHGTFLLYMLRQHTIDQSGIFLNIWDPILFIYLMVIQFHVGLLQIKAIQIVVKVEWLVRLKHFRWNLYSCMWKKKMQHNARISLEVINIPESIYILNELHGLPWLLVYVCYNLNMYVSLNHEYKINIHIIHDF
jgi:hypothetical protein